MENSIDRMNDIKGLNVNLMRAYPPPADIKIPTPLKS
jgi:hypothetical protein